jgi:xylan 1,4-beta-xylosidase
MVRDSSIRGSSPDIHALATKDNKDAAIMLWNYHDDDLATPARPVTLQIRGLESEQVLITHYRIDQEHSNSYEVWKKMGSPQHPSAEQFDMLEKAGQLQMLSSPQWIKTKNGEITINMQLPSQAVSLLRIN